MIASQPLHLIKRPLVVIEPQPGHPVQNGLRGLRGRAFEIGILYSQNKLAAMPAGIRPGKEWFWHRRCGDSRLGWERNGYESWQWSWR